MAAFTYRQTGPATPITRSVRAYFAPVNRTSAAVTVFDPSSAPEFSLEAPPVGWIDCGWIKDFVRNGTTSIEPLVAGVKGTARSTARARANAEISFQFRQWGKLQMAISCGAQHMNLLAEAAGAAAQPSGGNAATKVAVGVGSSATELMIGAANVSAFAPGDIVAVDRDYTVPGYVGAGISAAYVRNSSDVGANADYTRRVTFNVARVNSISAASLLLASPLLAGAPTTDMFVQKVIGFVDREGGSYFQEFSALFVAEAGPGGRLYYYYPRVRTAATATESRAPIVGGFDAWSLPAKLIALPTTDINDNEQVLCYRSYIPAKTAAI